MKTLAALALALVAAAAGLAHANRSVELSALEHLQALDGSSGHSGTKAAFTWVNENALEHLPVAATLRAEDALAGLVLHVVSGAKEQALVVAAR